MCKVKFFLFAVGLLSLLASCAGDPERHELTPVEQRIILYADQTLDSLRFYTYDSWTVTSQAEWITVEGDGKMDVAYDYQTRYFCRVFLHLLPNTTGRSRQGTVHVKSYDYAYSAPFVQLGLLNISHPSYTTDAFLDEQSHIPSTAHYELLDSAHWTADSICFSVENNWELLGELPEWLSADKRSGLPGKHSVHLTFQPNLDTENAREAKLKLTSGEVENDIIIRQLPARKEEE